MYLRKQKEILSDSAVHLVEIDLLRGGEHTTAVPYNRAKRKAGLFDYHVCVHRFDQLEDFYVYPILLAEKLPTISIPLLPRDPDVTVDLQAVFNRCYEAGRYDREIRYQQEQPIPPLRADLAAWSELRLKLLNL